MNKFLISLLSIIMFVPIHAYAKPEISAGYACLMEAKTGTVVYEYNGYEKHSMASTTKIMTALVALENSSPDEIVTISRKAAYQEGSSAYLAEGECIRMHDLLYGLMLNSGNDAAVAIAEHISGTEESFAEEMTLMAKSLGANSTSFKNASGLDDEEHYTTAVDLASITSKALENEMFREIVSHRYKEVEYSGGTLHFSNHNKLLKQYDGCIGVKTGYTKKTGRCLVSAAEKNGITMICVTLVAPDDWNDHKKLLDYGFNMVELDTAVDKGQIFKYIPTDMGSEIPAVASENVILPSIKGVRNSTELILHTIDNIDSSISVGEKIGECEIKYDGKFVKEIDILAGEEYIKKKTFIDYLLDFWRDIFNSPIA